MGKKENNIGLFPYRSPLYNYGVENTIPDHHLKYSIDYIILYIKMNIDNDLNSFKEILEKYSERKPIYWKDKNYFTVQYTIKIGIGGQVFQLYLTQNSKLNYCVMLKITRPDKYIFKFIEWLLRRSYYHVTELELSFDFYPIIESDRTITNLYLFLKSNTYLSWPGRSDYSPPVYSTSYINNSRKQKNKGSKIYLKTINGDRLIRLELTLKRKLVDQRAIMTPL